MPKLEEEAVAGVGSMTHLNLYMEQHNGLPVCGENRTTGGLNRILGGFMTLEEKDKYIADHLMELSNETLRFMVADLHAEVERLEKENSAVKEELFDTDFVALMDACKKYATENFRLKAEIKNMAGPDKWRREPPDEQALWWWWNEDGWPIPVSILFSGTENRYFASIGQHGWNRTQYVEDMGGWWMRCVEPPLPESV